MFLTTESPSSLRQRSFQNRDQLKKRGGTMTRRSNKLFSILLFASGIFFFSNALAQAQACTQAVYLFRHAEDQSNVSPTRLTDVGNRHAALYPGMIDQLKTTLGICAVQRVFAM